MTKISNGLAEAFARLHRPGEPLTLFNIWDPGSAKAVAEAGAKALATGSWSVAAAFGFEDGEDLPRDLAMANLRRIAASVDLPVSVDLEGGYGEAPEVVAETAALAITAGAVGCNFEDRVVGDEGMHALTAQQARIAAMRKAAEGEGVSFFINARTDCFLLKPPAEHHRYIDEAIERSRAYADAGASGFFVPGLTDEASIARVCAEGPLPVNIMMMPAAPSPKRLAELGVARISYGPGPYSSAMAALSDSAKEAFAA